MRMRNPKQLSTVRTLPVLPQGKGQRIADINHEMARRLRFWLFAQHYSRSTYDFYYSVSRKFCLYLGERPLRDVHPTEIAAFLSSSISPVASDTVMANWLRALRAFFDFLCLGGAVD